MAAVTNILGLLVAYIAWQFYVHNYGLKTNQTPRVSGYFHPAFRKVAEVFKQNVESGFERGAAFAVYHNGKPLIDMWGGWADISSQRHWQEDTASLSFSMVKGVTAIVMARLVDMGYIDYKKEVYHYWPEFGTEDKKNITVEMLLNHQAGLIGLDEKVSINDYQNNWDKVENQLAKQKPFWPPGTAFGYHIYTYGMYADALVRKVDPQQRNLSQFFQEEIALPLDIEFYIGLPKQEYHRFARVQPASIWELRFDLTSMIEMYTNQYMKIAVCMNIDNHDFNNPDVLSVGHPAVMGVGPARNLAKLFDYLANNGSIKAKRLLSPALVEAFQGPLTAKMPSTFILKNPITRGLFPMDNKQGHKILGHYGYGGSVAFADLTAGVGVVYSTNYLAMYMLDDPRALALRNVFYECFETYKREAVSGRGV
ncbi:unnamed protein product [Candidula unifasciata]|uniref:Beta-lactamase-related domain-containing protein n=1 Tax=Candidula unifasciata TaxID=100452 RepID=A0A8S3Z0L3_9EUPU|nr:unnamed protein product [Candidula unifasciata]